VVLAGAVPGVFDLRRLPDRDGSVDPRVLVEVEGIAFVGGPDDLDLLARFVS
jgi:hypothetical protein